MAMTDDELQAELARRGLTAQLAPARVVAPTVASAQPPRVAVPVPAPSRPAGTQAPPTIGAVPNVAVPTQPRASQATVLGAVPSTPLPGAPVNEPPPPEDDPPITGCPHCGERSCPHTRPDCDYDGSCDGQTVTSFGGTFFCLGHARMVWRSMAPERRDAWVADAESRGGVPGPADQAETPVVPEPVSPVDELLSRLHLLGPEEREAVLDALRERMS